MSMPETSTVEAREGEETTAGSRLQARAAMGSMAPSRVAERTWSVRAEPTARESLKKEKSGAAVRWR